VSDRAGTIDLASVGCELALADVYDRVLPAERAGNWKHVTHQCAAGFDTG
jgi:hypothetical protein